MSHDLLVQMAYLSKTLEDLLMRLVVFVNTIFQLNLLNITVSVCYVSGSKVNRKERSRPSLFVCLFLCSALLNISISEHLVPSCHCHVWISTITGITTAPPIKVVVPLLGHCFILRNSRLFLFVIMWDE